MQQEQSCIPDAEYARSMPGKQQVRIQRKLFIVVAQGDNDKAIVFHGVDHAVALRDAAGPETCKIVLERLYSPTQFAHGERNGLRKS